MLSLFLAPVLLPAGCLLEGENRAFGDESGRVSSLRVNAFQGEHEGAAGGVVEVTGVAEEGTFHAFRGEIRVTLERQRPGEDQPTYGFVKAWSLEVEEDDFASPTIPKVVHVIPPADFPEPGTYRVRVSATAGSRALTETTALFDFGGA